jgi:hypothetical protein
MGQAIERSPEAAALSRPGGSGGFAIGAYLRRQRELRGIELDQLSALTRIPRRSLERLEAGAFDRDPDGFVRGFVRTVASALGLDPDETANRLHAEPDPAARHLAGRGLAIAAGLALAALLALALLASLLPQRVVSERREAAAVEPAADAAAPPRGGPGLVVRRDAVRELARAHGLLEPAGPTDADPTQR